mgnify:CR=1 FL=1
MPQTQKTTTPYVHTFPNGSVAVVLDVPTDYSEGEEEAFRAFSPEVAERLYDILHAIEAKLPSLGQVVVVRFPEGQEGEVEHPAPVGERGALKLYLSPFCGVRGARPREGMVLQVVLGDGQEILWDGSRLYWKAEGKRLPLYPPSEGPLFFLGVWEGDGSFRLLFSPATSEFPGGVILALRVGEGWLEAERWRKGAEPFPTERIDGRFLPLGFGTSPEEVVSFFEKVWGTP